MASAMRWAIRVGHDAVDFADMADGVFASDGFQSHRAVGRDQPTGTIAPPHLPIVARFGAGACDGQISAAFRIGGIDKNFHSSAGEAEVLTPRRQTVPLVV
jgi:hypothetical protein